MSFTCATDKVKYRCTETRSHGNSITRRYVCPVCQKKFKTKEVVVQIVQTAAVARKLGAAK